MRGHLLISLLAALLLVTGCSYADTPVAVGVDTSVRHQTILGWGKTTPWLPASEMQRDQCLQQAVGDFGINRLRFEGMCGNSVRRRSWEWLNDNADPFDINWAGFNTAALDGRAADWLVSWKQAVEARGETFDLYLSPSFFVGGSTGDLPPWMKADPQEYAEWALALMLWLRDKHGIVPQWYSICNEAGNNNAFTPQVVARMIKALMPRLREAGFSTMVQFPESVNAQVAWRYIEQLQGDAEVWPWVGLISYHWYGRDNQTSMVKLRDFALKHNWPTAQTEFMNLTMDHLYDDMTLGGTSYWEIYGLGTPDYQAALSHISSTSFRAGNCWWQFRQVAHYVRPGAVRVEATSSDAGLRCLAFERDGRVTVVLINTGPTPTDRQVVVTGLLAGSYGVSSAVGRNACQELGLCEVGEGGALPGTVPANCVLTIYPHEGANQPPAVTQWRSKPDFLTLPASSLQLICSATDPELDPLTCSWTVQSAPEGAQVVLAQAGAPTTRADGLALPGDYIFAATVSDGTHEVTREVLVKVFEGNQPPVLTDVHNRIPVWVTVREGGTLLRAAAWDIEGDKVSFRWSVLTQPEGAQVSLETPDDVKCQVRLMTVPGDYVFRVEGSDGAHTVSQDLTVPVYP